MEVIGWLTLETDVNIESARFSIVFQTDGGKTINLGKYDTELEAMRVLDKIREEFVSTVSKQGKNWNKRYKTFYMP